MDRFSIMFILHYFEYIYSSSFLSYKFLFSSFIKILIYIYIPRSHSIFQEIIVIINFYALSSFIIIIMVDRNQCLHYISFLISANVNFRNVIFRNIYTYIYKNDL